MQIVQTQKDFGIAIVPVSKMELTHHNLENHLLRQLFEQRIVLAETNNSVEKQRLLPDITFSYLRGLNNDVNDHLSGYQAGLRIPILFSGNAARIRAGKIAVQIAEEEALQNQRQLESRLLQLMTRLQSLEEALVYYEQEGNELSEEILRTANLAYRNGEIDFFQYIQSLENGYRIRLSSLDSLFEYNQTVILINNLLDMEL